MKQLTDCLLDLVTPLIKKTDTVVKCSIRTLRGLVTLEPSCGFFSKDC